MDRLPQVDIDLSSIDDAQDLHRLLRDSLDFPGWYGCNWDAFWDAISALVEMPLQLHFNGWEAFAGRLPREAQMIGKCLAELKDKYPEFASDVFYR